jgi:serine/threonine protein kinase
MKLSDNAVERLRAAAELPDLGNTRYRILGNLGHGGMGSVYRVEDSVLGRQVALKVIGFSEREGELANRLVHEARVLAQLEHPGIVPVHDVGALADGRVFYTMKLVQGKRLDEFLSSLTGLNERLRVFQKICEPVAFAHAYGVLHRDLKPQNIMIGPFGEVLVMDWGLSKLLQDHGTSTAAFKGVIRDGSATQHGSILGTPGYMSPEQARGDTDAVDRRSDVYSLGAILKSVLENNVPAPRSLRAIADKCLEQQPSRRYSSVPELERDIANYLDALPVNAYPEGPSARIWRWMVKNRPWLMLVAAYLVMRTIFILWRSR